MEQSVIKGGEDIEGEHWIVELTLNKTYFLKQSWYLIVRPRIYISYKD